jgi:Dolichyl-phosphate-mannose-protein mannosyltransferase
MRRGGIVLPLCLFLITLLTRIPFTSKLLYHMDSVQFALALNDYNVTVHQPHPPGYFLYIMLGRLVYFFAGDANTTYVSISIFFSGLTVAMVYLLGRELFGPKTGLIAAVLAMTSPNLWFHGEVALTYILEAFFSVSAAFLCWKIYKGAQRHIWLSAVLLGIAGGIRQDTVVFLLPLWLFSVKALPPRKIIAAAGLMALACLSWFVPMLWMTGGWKAYSSAFRELWLFNTGHVSVFDRGWSSFRIFSSTVFNFILYGIGAGVFVLCLAAYSVLRGGKAGLFLRGKSLFFIFWVLPSTLFYLLVFIHPANPGYVLVMLPALFILTAESACFLGDELRQIVGRELTIPVATIMVAVNIFIFLFTTYPVSYPTIRTHDRDLKVMLQRLSTYDAARTAFFVGPYIFFGYRQIMYYLPAYRVYQVDVREASTGEMRKTFWGVGRRTFLDADAAIPGNIRTFVAALISGDSKKADGIKGVIEQRIKGTQIFLASGKIAEVARIYPGFRFHLQDIGPAVEKSRDKVETYEVE